MQPAEAPKQGLATWEMHPGSCSSKSIRSDSSSAKDGGAIDLKLSNFGNSGKVCPLSLPVRLGLYVGGTEKLLHVSGNRSVATV